MKTIKSGCSTVYEYHYKADNCPAYGCYQRGKTLYIYIIGKL